jgi:ferredoxin/flavodoxin---NADP+ reductase
VEFNPDKYALATIAGRRDFAEDLWVIKVKTDIELPYRPGQYVTLGLSRGERIIERPYSICSDPEEGVVELFIERVPEGELSAPLFDLQEGEQVLVRKRCKGLFLKDATSVAEPHLLVATVTGVAPFVSLVRSLARRQRAGEWDGGFQVAILQGASHSSEFGYYDELTELAGGCDWFTYIPTVSRPWADETWTGEKGRVEDVLRMCAGAMSINAQSGGVYLCGHPGMIANARAIMRRAGLDDKAIREEQYWPD